MVPQSKEGLVMTFGPIDAKKVDLPHSDNLINRLNIGNCILKRVLIDSDAGVSIMYMGDFLEMGFLMPMLNLPKSTIKLFDNNLPETLGVIQLPMKHGNDDSGYLEPKKRFTLLIS